MGWLYIPSSSSPVTIRWTTLLFVRSTTKLSDEEMGDRARPGQEDTVYYSRTTKVQSMTEAMSTQLPKKVGERHSHDNLTVIFSSFHLTISISLLLSLRLTPPLQLHSLSRCRIYPTNFAYALESSFLTC